MKTYLVSFFLVLFFIYQTGYSQDPSLVAYYSLNGHAQDLSGNDNHGSFSGTTPAENRFSQMDSARYFDGSDDYITIPHNTSQLFDEGLTICAWVKPEMHRDSMFIFSKWGGNEESFIIGINDECYPFGKINLSDNSEISIFTTDVSMNNGRWYFIAMTFDNDWARLYINNQEMQSYQSNLNIYPGTLPINIGQDNRGNNRFSGAIDDCRLFNRSLRSSEIDSLFRLNGWAGEQNKSIAYYKFSGNGEDFSGENHLTVHGAIPADDRFGNKYSAYSFNGISDYLIAPFSTDFDLDNQDFSISVWINASNIELNDRILNYGGSVYDLFTFKGTSQNNLLGAVYVNGEIGTYTTNGETEPIFISNNQWHHLVFVRSNTNDSVAIFLDNKLASGRKGGAGNLYIKEGDRRFVVGRTEHSSNQNESYFHGKIDDIEIFNWALSSEEINPLYHQEGWPVTPDTTIIVAGTITTDSLWTRDNGPYLIHGELIVNNGGRLTIEPGVEIIFDYNAYLHIRDKGSLIANGTENDSIYFYGNGGEFAFPQIELGVGKGIEVRYCRFNNIHQQIAVQEWSDSGPCIVEHSGFLNSDFDYEADDTLRFNSLDIKSNLGLNVNALGNHNYVLQNNNITGGLSVEGKTQFIARYNYWGEPGTSEMNEGNNPKNISVIIDFYDNTELGEVDYSNWLDAPWPEGNPVHSPDSSLVLYLNGDDNLEDISFYNRTVSSENTRFVKTPWPGTAFNFTGDGYLMIPDTDNRLDFEDEFTIEMMIYFRDHNWSTFFIKGGLENPGKNLTLQFNKESMDIGFGTGGITAHLAGIPKLYEWYKLAIQVKGDSIRYILNSEIGNWTDGGVSNLGAVLKSQLNDDPLHIGTGYATGGVGEDTPPYYFNGLIDEIKVHKRVLDAEELYQMPVIPDTTYIYGGELKSNSVWTKEESPYLLSGDLVVVQNSILTIEPGVEVYITPWRDDYKYEYDDELDADRVVIAIFDSMSAIGIENDSILFTSNSLSPKPGDWGQIYTPGTKIHIEHAIIKYGKRGINGGDAQLVNVINSHFSDLEGEAIQIGQAGLIQNNLAERCNSGISALGNAAGLVESNVFRNNIRGIHCDFQATTLFQKNLITGNEFGINFNQQDHNLAIFRNNEIRDNGQFDVTVESDFDADLRFNYWGSSTTTQMSTSESLINISTINDNFDNPSFGLADYSSFLDAPWPDGKPVYNGTVPQIISTQGIDVGVTTAGLQSEINPQNVETKTIFEYGTSVAYGDSVTAIPEFINGDTSQVVTARISGLIKNTQYHFRVVINSAGRKIYGEEQIFKTNDYPQKFSAPVISGLPSRPDPQDYTASDYRMIGFPGDINIPVADVIPGEPDKQWMVYWDNGNTTDFQVKYDGSNMFNFTSGKAFWVVSMNDVELSDSITASSLNSEDEVVIPLHSGWNLITNPFPESVIWQTVVDRNNIPIEIYKYETSFQQTTELKPYQGYLIENKNNLSSLHIPFPSNSSSQKARQKIADWMINVDLIGENFHESVLCLGVIPQSSESYDIFEGHKPRMFDNTPGLWFEKPEWDSKQPAFASDFRPALQEMNLWEISLNVPVNETVELQFKGLNGIPDQYEVYLIDRGGKKAYNLREDSIRTIKSPVRHHKLDILVGTGSQIDNKLAALTPQEYILEQNFPNPFNPNTIIPFQIPHGSHVDLTIYNVLGERVTTIYTGNMESGRHLVPWNGQNEIGLKVPSGIYFLRMTAGEFTQNKKLILIR